MKIQLYRIFVIVLFVVSIFSLSANTSENWFRTLEIDAYENIIGRHQIKASESRLVNAYQFSYDDFGRLIRIDYRKAGRSIAVPEFGVPSIRIEYEESYIHRRFTDDTGKPVANVDGIWGQRIPLDSLGRAIGLINYDKFENIIPDKNRIAQRLWELDSYGRKNVERIFNSTGAQIEDNRGIAEVRYQWDDKNHLQSKRYFDISRKATLAQGEGVHRYKWFYNVAGDTLREERFDTQGNPVIAFDGSFAVEWNRDERGLPKIEKRLGITGDALADVHGVAFYQYTYDVVGNLIEQSHLNKDKELVRDISGVVTYKWIHYSQGNELEQLNLDENLQLIEDDSGMASYRWTYDKRGLIVSSISFGLDDQPKKDIWGIAQYQYVYDDNRNLIEASSYGDWETLTMDSSGVVIYQWEYDSFGNRSVERHYNAEGEMVEDVRGIAEYRWTYDSDKRRIEQRQYGLFDQLRADPEGVAIYTWNYDGYGRTVERRHYGVDEQPVDNKSGAALARWSYDKDGRVLTFARFDRRTLPTE